MAYKKSPELKPLLVERMKKLLTNPKDFEKFIETIKKTPANSIRCNTLKISPEELKLRLEKKGWEILQPFKEYLEVMIIKNDLEPGELGRSLEHLLGYYYVQEIASMLPVFVLKPKPNQIVLDLCASPGSKTTQIAAKMQNTGTIIANEISLKRIIILASNMERCGVANSIITKKEGTALCNQLKREGLEIDKILVDAPCSGEGTLRSSQKTSIIWNINTVKQMSKIQKNLLLSAINILKKGEEIVYSTCTHSPEENEEVIDFILKNYKNIKIESINLPITCRPGLIAWNGQKYDDELTKSCRIYPQDNNTEGFFLAKLRKTGWKIIEQG